MIQKLRTYKVNRAVKELNIIGEQVEKGIEEFDIQMAISVSSGSNFVSNLVKTTNSTHSGVYFIGELKVGDYIINGGERYRVTYVYPLAAKKAVALEMVSDG